MSGAVHFERDGDIGVITIDRPERKNALNAQMCADFSAHLAAQRDVRALVLTGAGDAFCAGADLVTRIGDDHSDAFRPAFELLQDGLEAFPAPVIAAVDGPAIGAGTQLLTACDLRVAGRAARFAIPAARIGLILSAANLERLLRLVGSGAARDLLFTSRTLDQNEAFAMGLVDRVVKSALDAARLLAFEIATLAPLSVQGHKQALLAIERSTVVGHELRAELGALEAAAFASADLQEGVTAFQEKRRPVFRGE
ncbi:MAG: enoyl-CoA hydratase/isomerase family protein [Acidimicrobiia bacterium]